MHDVVFLYDSRAYRDFGESRFENVTNKHGSGICLRNGVFKKNVLVNSLVIPMTNKCVTSHHNFLW